jgi:hypothetical protein
MKYPQLRPVRASKQFMQVFGGYNRSLKIREGEWYDTTNLSTRNFPLLSPRPVRGIAASALTTPYAIGGNQDGVAYVDGATLYYKGAAVSGLTLSVAAGMTDKRIIPFGAYLIILPDLMYYNTADPTDKGSIANLVTTSGNIAYTMCRDDGTAFTGATISDTAPANPAHGDYWIDTSADIHLLMQFSELSNVWVSIPNTFAKLSNTGIGVGFEVGDGVTISGCLAGGGESAVMQAQILALNGSNIIVERGDDYIVITGILDQTYTQTSGNVVVNRECPLMDYVTVCGNRLWGCRCGLNNAGATVNEIYASALGDFKNFAVFEGISTDSYSVTVGQGGNFTGAAAHQGYPIFFKEDVIYKIFGSRPANYQVADTQGRGVQAGCDKSIALINETLFYKARDCVCAYDGASPSSISDALGEVLYSDARGGALKDKYYLSMKDSASAWHLFVLDTKKGIWMREDALQAIGFHAYAGDLYFINASTKKITTVLATSGTAETSVTWSAESGLIGYAYPGRQYVSRLNIRVQMGTNASVTVSIKYDSESSWTAIGTRTVTTAATKTLLWPVMPRRCDHFALKLAGTGDVAIYSIEKVLEMGGDGVGNV